MIEINSGSKGQNAIRIHVDETFTHLHRLTEQSIPSAIFGYKWLSHIPKFHLPSKS